MIDHGITESAVKIAPRVTPISVASPSCPSLPVVLSEGVWVFGCSAGMGGRGDSIAQYFGPSKGMK